MSPVLSYPLAGYGVKPTVKAQARMNPLHRLFTRLLWLVVALGAYVINEPAPYDIGILVVFALAICTHAVQVSRHVLVAGSALLLFLVTSSILTAPPMDWDRWLHHSGATIVLAVSWLLYAGVTHRFGARAANAVLQAYLVAAVVSASAAVAGYFELIPDLRATVITMGRARAFFKDPNVFGPFLLAPTLICATLIQEKSASTAKRILVGCAGTVLLAAILLTYSRAAYATTLFAVACYAVLTGVLRSWRSFVWLGVALGCAALLLSSIPNATYFLGQRLEMHRYDQDRFQVFEMALSLGTGNLLGVGTGQSHHILGYGVHSMYLRLFADHGAVGLVTFLAFVGLCVSRMTTQLRRAQTPEGRRLAALLLAATVGTLINGVVIETIHWRHLWLLLGLCWYPFPEQQRRFATTVRTVGGRRSH